MPFQFLCLLTIVQQSTSAWVGHCAYTCSRSCFRPKYGGSPPQSAAPPEPLPPSLPEPKAMVDVQPDEGDLAQEADAAEDAYNSASANLRQLWRDNRDRMALIKPAWRTITILIALFSGSTNMAQLYLLNTATRNALTSEAANWKVNDVVMYTWLQKKKIGDTVRQALLHRGSKATFLAQNLFHRIFGGELHSLAGRQKDTGAPRADLPPVHLSTGKCWARQVWLQCMSRPYCMGIS